MKFIKYSSCSACCISSGKTHGIQSLAYKSGADLGGGGVWGADQLIFRALPKHGFVPISAKFLAEIGTKPCFGRARKINLVDLKKKVVKIFENFLKIRPPPLEKILDPPLLQITKTVFRAFPKA